MATFSDQYTLATTPGFIQRVEIALVTAAVAVMNEAEATPDHSFRRTYAAQVLADPAAQAAKATVGVATNATIAASAPTGVTATDSDIQFTVNSLFGAYALR